MLRYGDYFSRKTLYRVGLSPDERLPIKGEDAYLGDKRKGLILSDMKGIYQTFVSALNKNNVNSPKEVLSQLNVERKIVSAFYDTGVLTNEERDYFRVQSLENEPMREQIFVEEAGELSSALKSSAHSPSIKSPVVEKVKR